MKMSRPLGLFFPARRPPSGTPEAAAEPLSDDQLAHPLTRDAGDADSAWAPQMPEPAGAAWVDADTMTVITADEAVAEAEVADADNVVPQEQMPPGLEVTPRATIAAAQPVIGRPHMTAAELSLLDRTMKSGFARYLEFGAGGSTLLAVRSGIDTVVSVESDLAWTETVRNHPEIAPRLRAGRAAILHADIGPTKAFGAPVDSASLDRWPSYIRLPWVEWHRRGAMPDFVFVDGRFRVACCLSVIVAWHLSPRQSPFPLIAIHDVTPQRRSYQRLFTLFDSVESVETLHLLRLKEDVSPLAVFTTLLGVQFDPS